MKKIFLLLAAVGMIFTACQSGGDVEEDNGGTPFVPEITISPKYLTFDCNGGEQAVDITANFEYEVAERASWLTVEQTDEGLLVVVDTNKNASERSAFISITNSQYDINKIVEVWQEGFVAKIELAQQSVEVEFEPAEYEVAVTSPYSWEATTMNDWIVIESETGIADEEVLRFSTKRNEEEKERKGTITLKNTDYNLVAELYVTQKAFVSAITIEPELLVFTFEGGTQEVAITANFEYEFSTTTDWLTIEKSEKGVNISATQNTKFEECTAEITISNKKYNISKTISVVQKGVSAKPENVIIYTSSNGDIVTPKNSNVFGANIVSNIYSNVHGQGIIIFDAPVTSIGKQAFDGCTSLTSVTIPDSVTSIGDKAFQNCTSLTSVTIPDSVTSIGSYAFAYCSSLTSVTIPDSVTSIGESAFNQCSSLTSVTIGNGVTSIGNDAFSSCKSLTSITIPDSVTSIGEEAFDWCTSLTSITIPDSVTSIGDYAFYYCRSLTSVTIGNGDTSIGNYAFGDCSSLTSVTIGNGVTSIGKEAFAYCSSLTSVTIGNRVTSIGKEAFAYCSSLTSVDISDLSAWCKIDFGSSSANPLCYAKKFHLNGTEITELTIPSDVTTIKNYVFSGCSSLTSVTIPDSVTSIGISAFSGCSSLTSVTIGNSVTSIGSWAFLYCSSLTSVTIPDSVTSIGEEAFYYCSSLTSVYCKPTTPPTGGNNMFYKSSLIRLYVPAGSVETYERASHWKNYGLYIVGYDFEKGVTAIEFTTDSVKAAIPDITTNGYGSQNVTNYSTFLTWDVFAACKLCLPPAGDYANANCLQMQGNTDAAKQGRVGNVVATPKRITKVIVESYNAKYTPNFNLALGTEQVVGTSVPDNMIPASSMTTSSVVEGALTKYVSTYEVTSGDYTYFAIYKNTTGALYFSKVRVEYAE